MDYGSPYLVTLIDKRRVRIAARDHHQALETAARSYGVSAVTAELEEEKPGRFCKFHLSDRCPCA